MDLAYWICLLVGISYTIISGLLGGMGGHVGHLGHVGHIGHVGGHVGHGPVGHHYGVSGRGHGQAGPTSDSGGTVIFGPFSPLVIAFFLTCFGGVGLIVSHMPLLRVFSLPAAALSGFVLAWLLILFFNKVIGGVQGSSEVRLYTLLGTEAEVTVAIPENGIGEIAYIAMGSRNVGPARSDEQVPIARFTAVRIARIVGNIFYVRPAIEEELRNLRDELQPTGTPPGEGGA